MAETTGDDWQQIKAATRHGTQAQGQASDGTGTSGNLPKFNADGSLTDSGIAASAVGVSPYHIGCFVEGKPDASELILEWTCPRDLPSGVSFVADLTTSSGRPKTNPTSSAVYNIYKILSNSTTETAIGTITIATSGVPTFSTSGTAYTFLPGSPGDTPRGDTLRVYGPTSQDATLADFGFVLAGTR